MMPAASLGFRFFYIAAGLFFIGLAVVESSSASVPYVPILLGVLLIVQGASGA